MSYFSNWIQIPFTQRHESDLQLVRGMRDGQWIEGTKSRECKRGCVSSHSYVEHRIHPGYPDASRLFVPQMDRRVGGHAFEISIYIILKNFTARLEHTVTRTFQTLFPRCSDSSETEVFMLHNQQDFLFFRRHSFRSTENGALEEIGLRFTLKLRSLPTGLPVVDEFGRPSSKLELN